MSTVMMKRAVFDDIGYFDENMRCCEDYDLWLRLAAKHAIVSLDVPLAAFTATADAETQAEIVQKLFDGVPPRAFLRGFDRPNIHLAFAAKNKPRDQILDFAAARKGQSGIVYLVIG